MKTTWGEALAAILLSMPPAVHAQIAWDTPRLIGPESPGGLGVLRLRSDVPEGRTDGATATWALPGTDGRVILRGGAGLDDDDRVSVLGGIDLRTPLARHTEEQPLDLEWYAGIGGGGGAGSEQYMLVTLPLGVSAGRAWTSGSVWLAPYVALGVALDLGIGEEDAPDDELTASPAADLGVDFALAAGRRFIIRVATSLGDRQALALGLNLGG
jgi:hypothetical protein